MTRADWYTQQHGGGWRTARTKKRCDMTRDGIRCLSMIQPGQQYFDTNARNHAASCVCAKINLCAACAGEEIK